VITTPFEHAIVAFVAFIVILGFYEAYFIFQRLTLSRYRSLETVFDGWFPYQPSWVWVYSFFYYGVLISLVFTLKSYADFVLTTVSYIFLLVLQLSIFAALPVSTPLGWRHRGAPRSVSERLLMFVQRIDANSNCFPSMHTSVAILTALHLHRHTSIPLLLALIYPLLIGLSALFTKQHFFLDVVAACVVGILPYVWFLRII
jgi:membrane-associated phospholipid phosphatase